MLLELIGHRFNRHHLAGVPEQMAEHDEACAGVKSGLQALENTCIGVACCSPQMLHRKGIDHQLFAASELYACGHHPRVLAVAY